MAAIQKSTASAPPSERARLVSGSGWGVVAVDPLNSVAEFSNMSEGKPSAH